MGLAAQRDRLVREVAEERQLGPGLGLWLEGDATREPKNYESAFLGFAERFVRDAR
jgi:hypothetical protein